jgi:hypothetical protein
MAPSPPSQSGVVVDYGTHEIEFPDEDSARKYSAQFAKQTAPLVGPIEVSKPKTPEIPHGIPQIPATAEPVNRPSIGQKLSSGVLNSFGPLGMAVDNAKLVSEQPILRNFTRSATAGLSEPLAAGLGALVSKGVQEVGLMDGNKTIGQFYDRAMERQREGLKKMKEESPVQSFVGDVAGVAAPGGAFNKLYGGTSKIAGRVLPQVGNIPKYGRFAIQGGLSNMGYGAMNEGAKELGGEEGNFKPGEDFLMGAAFDAGGRALSAGAGKVLSGVRDMIGNSAIPDRIRGLPGMGWLRDWRKLKVDKAKESFNASEAAKRADYENARNSFIDQKDLISQKNAEASLKATEAYRAGKQGAVETAGGIGGLGNKSSVGQNLQDAVGATSKKVLDNYKKVVDPIIERNGNASISPEIIRKKIVGTLKIFGIDGKDQAAWKRELKNGIFGEEEARALGKLITYSEKIVQNPTLKELRRLERAIGSSANFGGKDITPENKIFQDVWHSARDNVLDAVQSLAGPEKAKGVDAARRTFFEKNEALKTLKDLTRFQPEQVIGSKKMSGSYLVDAIKKNPEIKDSVRDAVLKDIISKSRTPVQFTNAINKYERESLKKIFGDQLFKQVEDAEKRLVESFRPMIRPPKTPLPNFNQKWTPGTMPPVPENAFYRGIQNALTPGKGSEAYQKYIAPFMGSRSIPAMIQPKVGDSI